MLDLLLIWAFPSAFGILFWLVFMGATLAIEYDEGEVMIEHRTAARAFFAILLWPIVLPVLIVVGVQKLWIAAEFWDLTSNK